MRIFVLILGIFFSVFSSCNLSTSERTKVSYKKNYKEALSVYLSKNHDLSNEKIILGNEQTITLTNIDWIREFYTTSKFHPIWINDSLLMNSQGEKFVNLLSKSMNYGLDTNFYPVLELSHLADNLKKINRKDDRFTDASNLEILLTNSYFLYGKHLNYGITHQDSSLLFSIIPRKKLALNMPVQLLKANKSDSVIEYLLALQPQHKEYKKLQKSLENYLANTSLSKEKINVDSFRKDSIRSYQQSYEALILHNYLSKESSDSSYFEALIKFQKDHGLFPDKLIGKNTAAALSKSPYDYYKSVAANLERWRWKESWGDDYIYVNIASYQLKVYENNQLTKQHRVVVGKNDTRTPEIDDELEYLIVYPYWNLPYSISSKETLAKIKKDSTYLKRNNFEVFTKKYKPIDANTINWKEVTSENFNYKIRQGGGGSNSLGLIKFIFPNKHSVYFHDTPSKRYFKKDLRAYSHGCIRVQNPIELADHILNSDNNEYNMDSIHIFIKRRRQKQINLNHKIDVHIHYLTCEADSNNSLIFYKDIYKKNEKLIELMFPKNQLEKATLPVLVSK